MADITITINDNEIPRLRATAKANGMTAEEFKELLKQLCIHNINNAVKDYELKQAKNQAISDFHDNWVDLSML